MALLQLTSISKCSFSLVSIRKNGVSFKRMFVSTLTYVTLIGVVKFLSSTSYFFRDCKRSLIYRDAFIVGNKVI